jgi:acetolactate decarboxylase
MRRIPRAPGVLLAAAVLLAGCCRPPAHTIMQVSAIDALLAGAYDGQVGCAELLRHGDFGIGTFDRLDGEMAVLDGKVYQMRADGSVRPPGRGETTPFAMVTRFSPSCAVPLQRGMGPRDLESLLDRSSPDVNLFFAVRARGRFSAMKVRSVPPQKKPYPSLIEAARNQAVFERKGVAGTLCGFRSPAYAKGVTPPGYHLHFISDDRTFGGHVLDFTLESGTAEMDPCTRFLLVLPGPGSAFGGMDLGRDRTSELDAAERGR